MSWNWKTCIKNNVTDLVVIQTAGYVQNFSGGILQKLTVYNRVIRDILGQWNNTTYTFTAKENGVYFVNAKLLFAATNIGGERQTFLFKNGVNFLSLDFKWSLSNNTFTSCFGTATINLNAGDVLEFYMFSGLAGTSSQNAPEFNQLTINRLF